MTARSRRIVLFLFLTMLLVYQQFANNIWAFKSDSWHVTGSTGLYAPEYQKYFYFKYYLDLFPLAQRGGYRVFSKEGAEEYLKNGPALLMEIDHSFRSGENGKIFLYWPSAILTGTAKDVSVKPANYIALTLSLLAIFFAFAANGMPLFGFALAWIIGTNPFVVTETYLIENVFVWPIIFALLLMSINVKLFRSEPPRWSTGLAVAAIASGVVLSIGRQLRSEPVPLLGSTVLIYFLATTLSWKRRSLLALLAVSAFAITNAGFASYFNRSFEMTAAVLKQHGGIVYNGPRYGHHQFWHPLMTGLRELNAEDPKWHDLYVYKYVYPKLKAIYGKDFSCEPTVVRECGYYDTDTHRYYRHIQDFPEYGTFAKQGFIDTVKADPKAYLNLLRQRVWNILTDIPPLRLQLGGHFADVRVMPLGLFVLCIIGGVFGRMAFLRLAILTTPLATAAFLVYSKMGMTYFSIFHLVIVCYVLHVLWTRWKQRLVDGV